MFSFSLLPRGLSSVLSDVLNRVPSASFFTKRCATIPPIYAKPWERPYGEVSGLPESIGKVTAPDVRVRVRGGVVAVEVERAVVLVLVVVAADAAQRPRRCSCSSRPGPDTHSRNTDYWRDSPKFRPPAPTDAGGLLLFCDIVLCRTALCKGGCGPLCTPL